MTRKRQDYTTKGRKKRNFALNKNNYGIHTFMESPSHTPCISFSGIFSLFLRAGFSLPGAGHALIPRLEADLVVRRAWMSPGDFRDTVAVAECAPGVFAFNLGTGLGYRIDGLRGSLAAVAGLLLPAFVVMLALSCWLVSGARPSAWMEGMRPAVAALVALALVAQVRRSGIQADTLWISLAALLLVWLLGISPFLLVVAAGAGAYLYARYVKPLE